MDELMPLELTLRRRLRDAHTLLEQWRDDTAELRFRHAMLDILLQMAEDLAAGVVDLSLAEILDDTLQDLLGNSAADSAEPQWVEAA